MARQMVEFRKNKDGKQYIVMSGGNTGKDRVIREATDDDKKQYPEEFKTQKGSLEDLDKESLPEQPHWPASGEPKPSTVIQTEGSQTPGGEQSQLESREKGRAADEHAGKGKHAGK